MEKRFLISVVALAATAALSGRADAAGRDPLVVQGIVPGSQSDPFRDTAAPSPNAGRAPASAYRSAAPATRQPAYRQAQPQRNGGQYGGGFIEFLITGGESRPQPAYAPAPRSDHRSHLPAGPQRGAFRPGTQQAALEPAPSFRQGLSRTLDPKYHRQDVAYSGKHGAGTIIVDTPNRFLYLVQGNGRALRYGIGVGRPGFEWAGVKKVTRKAEWPGWTPPPEMRKRRPDLPHHMPGGPENPMGARALYLGSSLYRIHGTNEPETIGTNVSSGCIRLLNNDVKDLYSRVRVGAKVIVI